MKKVRILLLFIVSIGTFLVVYSPHFNYPFPSHIDEWHHISESIRLQTGEYHRGVSAYRIGFQIFLFLLSKFSNLVLIYQFLPASWSVLSGLLLFYLVYKKTDKQFFTGLFAMLFFASLKSNVNITGLWFFTPLTFSIPFIYLYVFLYTEGAEKQKKSYIVASIAIMLLLLFTHAISVLFAVLFLGIYTFMNIEYFKKERVFLLYFLIVAVAGTLFYKVMTQLSWTSLISNLINSLQFKYGWGVLELKNSFYELYSFAGYVFAGIGLLFVIKDKGRIKKYSAYVLWPITVIAMIFFYRKTNVSYLSPYQRNLYYYAISLPFLSAMGLTYTLSIIKEKILDKIKPARIKTAILYSVVFSVLVSSVALAAFKSYWYIPKNIDLYRVINNDDYQAILFLSTIPEKAVVMAVPSMSVAIYPISQHNPVATFFFYGNRKDAELFFRADNCDVREKLIDKHNVKYVLSSFPMECGWKLIYDMKRYIYEVK
ncbi:MAG: hypothetical protein JW800_08345 [Candidatus Omnitrophica bacterium]|nr:hypothetical protein [Candidatus Omnitrophota bacterium]